MRNAVLAPTIEDDHPGLVTLTYMLLIVAEIMTRIAALASVLALVKPCVKSFQLPHQMLFALVICMIGAYPARNHSLDVWIVLGD